ncbi:MAG TPA: hypothetical protein GX520_03935 [Syntrophaceticus sp.]|nr:hypothetical protein [Syntrophaceticus sp.]
MYSQFIPLLFNILLTLFEIPESRLKPKVLAPLATTIYAVIIYHTVWISPGDSVDRIDQNTGFI